MKTGAELTQGCGQRQSVALSTFRQKRALLYIKPKIVYKSNNSNPAVIG